MIFSKGRKWDTGRSPNNGSEIESTDINFLYSMFYLPWIYKEIRRNKIHESKRVWKRQYKKTFFWKILNEIVQISLYRLEDLVIENRFPLKWIQRFAPIVKAIFSLYQITNSPYSSKRFYFSTCPLLRELDKRRRRNNIIHIHPVNKKELLLYLQSNLV